MTDTIIDPQKGKLEDIPKSAYKSKNINKQILKAIN